MVDAPMPHGAPSGSVGAIVGNVKSTITRRINQMRHTPGAKVWQRNYWESIVCTPEGHARVDNYIRLNPARWRADDLHPGAPPNPFNQEED
jgi:putative transposase